MKVMEQPPSAATFSLSMDHHVNSPAPSVVFVWGPMSLPLFQFSRVMVGEGAQEWRRVWKIIKILKEEKASLGT